MAGPYEWKGAKCTRASGISSVNRRKGAEEEKTKSEVASWSTEKTEEKHIETELTRQVTPSTKNAINLSILTNGTKQTNDSAN